MAPALRQTPLKKARLDLGLTRRTVCAELDITEQTLQNWEKAVCTPPGDKLIRLARIYRRRPEELLEVA